MVLEIMENSPLSVLFSSDHGQQRRLLATRCQQLRDMQKALCKAFGRRFPAEMAVISTADGKQFEGFETSPFREVPVGVTEVLASVEFLPTDDPYFYDFDDRRRRSSLSLNASLEDEIGWEEAKKNGSFSGNLDTWMRIHKEKQVMTPAWHSPPPWTEGLLEPIFFKYGWAEPMMQPTRACDDSSKSGHQINELSFAPAIWSSIYCITEPPCPWAKGEPDDGASV
jgi:hypothetical protein